MRPDAQQVQGAGVIGGPLQDAAIEGLGLGELALSVESDGGGEGLGEGVHRDAGRPG
jgi:hypothetical protein